MSASESMQPGLPRNFLRSCLLLLIAESPSHGYDLLERLPEFGYRQVDAGGVYRALRVLEQERLVVGAWEPPAAGPPRRRYELTADGLDWLHATESTVRETRRVVQLFLDRYREVAQPAGAAPPAVTAPPAQPATAGQPAP